MPVALVPRLVGSFVAVLAAATLAWSAATADAVVVSRASQSSSEIRAYWTPERMQAAESVDPPQVSGSSALTPTAAPARGHSVEIEPSSGISTYGFQPGSETSFPQSVHGKIFFTVPGEGDAACSGTLVASRLQNVVFTAGHCVQYPNSQPSTNLVFVPGYRDGSEPFGEFPATTLLAPKEWTESSDISYDVAIAQLATPLEQQLGARGVAFNKAPKTAYKIFGYPGLPSPPYDGELLIQCEASYLGLEGGSHPFSTIASPCDMRQGSSGGGWVNPGGYVVSVVSHGYEDPSLAGQIVGPFFGDTIKRLYNQAGGSAQCPPAKQSVSKARKTFKKAKKALKRANSDRAERKAKKRLRKSRKKLNKSQLLRDDVC